MREYDMNEPDDMMKVQEAIDNVFMPCMKRLGDVDDLFVFRSLLASFIENWALEYDYDPVYIAISTANMMAEVHCNGDDEYDEYDEDDEE